MKKHILIASIVAAVGLAPIAALAQSDNPDAAGSSAKMKGPPNADGAAKGDAKSSETNAEAPKASGDNGAASAKASGASGDKKM